MAIASAAAELGVVVLRPMTEGRRYDLVFDVGPRLLRVQCKWGRLRRGVIVAYTGTCRLTPRGYIRSAYTADEIDAVAIYCPDASPRCYLLPIGDLSGQYVVHLRLTAAANNQVIGVKMAADYTLHGAIAQLGERRHGMAEVVGSSPTSSTNEAA